MGDRPNGGRVPGPDDDEINRIARVLIAEWERVERKPVNISYYATFADMARAMVADRRSEATLRADLAASQREVERCRVVLVDVINDRDLKQSEVGQCRELLSEMVANACTAGGILDSMGLAANADALRYLASIGRVEIVSEQGRRVIGRWKP